MEDRARQQFGADELAIVLSRYDLGNIESITPFTRGSRQSPKVGIVCERGKFLLKKRAKGRRSPARVAFAHAVQGHLSARGFPLPRLIEPRQGGDTVVRLGGDTYELFEYVSGHPFSATAGETADAGRTLARFHQLLGDFPIPEDAPQGTYHDTVGVRTALNAVPSSIAKHESAFGREAELLGLVQRLYEAYDDAAEQANTLGMNTFAGQVIHGDWHPGNMLFRDDKVLAVIDYDSCRLAQRLCDIANGALQFSVTGSGRPDQWPDHLDENRFAAFVGSYQSVVPIGDGERRALVPLMIEALVGESVLPIARTGSMGGWKGFGFLGMIARKVKWLQDHQQSLALVPRSDSERGGDT